MCETSCTLSFEAGQICQCHLQLFPQHSTAHQSHEAHRHGANLPSLVELFVSNALLFVVVPVPVTATVLQAAYLQWAVHPHPQGPSAELQDDRVEGVAGRKAAAAGRSLQASCCSAGGLQDLSSAKHTWVSGTGGRGRRGGQAGAAGARWKRRVACHVGKIMGRQQLPAQ